MSELDLVRDLFPERAVDPAARERVRAAVAARTSERRNRVFRRPRLVSAAGGVALAGAAASAIVIVFAGTSATVSASAARVLHRAASAALLERSVGTLAPGQYLYTRSVDEYLATTGGTRPDGTTWSYSALVPTVREIWLAANGSGWLHETGGAPTFLSDRDRQAWIADGRPNLGTGESNERLGGGGSDAQMTSLDLPSDPDALYARLHREAEGNGNGVYPEMFTLIGDALRENSTTPAQRAALYDVAARLPGIVLAGRTSDATGRPAIAVGDGQRPQRRRGRRCCSTRAPTRCSARSRCCCRATGSDTPPEPSSATRRTWSSASWTRFRNRSWTRRSTRLLRVISVARAEAVATVTVDRPDALNALDLPTLTELRDRLLELARRRLGAGRRAHRRGRPCVRRGRGHQVHERPRRRRRQGLGRARPQLRAAARDDAEADDRRDQRLRARRRLRAGARLRPPLRVDEARSWASPRSTSGSFPAGAARSGSPAVCGLGVAKEMILTGRVVDAEEALRIGLVERALRAGVDGARTRDRGRDRGEGTGRARRGQGRGQPRAAGRPRREPRPGGRPLRTICSRARTRRKADRVRREARAELHRTLRQRRSSLVRGRRGRRRPRLRSARR